jgi:thiamine kinase-like enzyme
MHPTVQRVIEQIPAWRTAQTIDVEPQPGGLTNANYRLTVDGERFVLRVSGDNAAQLGIRRQTECEALMAASNAGIAPEVLLFTQPEGHLVTRFVAGREWTMESFKAPDVIRSVAATLRRVHALPAIRGVFSPYRDIEQRLALAKTRAVTLPRCLDALVDKVHAIERERAARATPVLCHNDPFHNNFIACEAGDGARRRVYLLDWEFAGMGDRFFDLAAAGYFFSPEQKEFLLACYFGTVTDAARHALQQMGFVVAFWNAAWALLQIGHTHVDFDYAAMADNVFAQMEATL